MCLSHINGSLCLSPFLLLSLKIKGIISSGKDLKKEKEKEITDYKSFMGLYILVKLF